MQLRLEDTIERFGLLSTGDRILVAASGGKDSTACLQILNSLYQDVEAITIDASIGKYSLENLDNIRKFCKENSIRLHVVSFRQEFGSSLCYLQSVLKSRGLRLNSCAVCGILKRYLINRKARELKKTVVATGHNLDDESQSILMNILRSNLELLARLGPVSGVTSSKKFIRRVKPLYFVLEKEIVDYSVKMDFPVKYSRCPCASDAYRNSVRNLLNDYESRHPGAKRNIVSYFMRRLPKLKQFNGEIASCESCGEASTNRFCRTCEILYRNLK
ncbi:MAG: TIGR00269 family protein [Candidatus Woesearchaeota archaeon]